MKEWSPSVSPRSSEPASRRRAEASPTSRTTSTSNSSSTSATSPTRSPTRSSRRRSSKPKPWLGRRSGRHHGNRGIQAWIHGRIVRGVRPLVVRGDPWDGLYDEGRLEGSRRGPVRPIPSRSLHADPRRDPAIVRGPDRPAHDPPRARRTRDPVVPDHTRTRRRGGEAHVREPHGRRAPGTAPIRSDHPRLRLSCTRRVRPKGAGRHRRDGPPPSPYALGRGAEGLLRPRNPSPPHVPRRRDPRDAHHGRSDEPDPPPVPEHDARSAQRDPGPRLRAPLLGMRTPNPHGHQRDAEILRDELLQPGRRTPRRPGRLDLGHPGKLPHRARVAARHGPGRHLSKADRDRPSVGGLARGPVGPTPARSVLADDRPTVTDVPLTLPAVEILAEVVEFRLEVVAVRLHV